MKSVTRLAVVLLLAWARLAAQQPVAAALVNGASFNPYAAAGSIATVFGTNLASQTAFANTVPLPMTLGGTSVTIGGVAAPLFYVSPGQINFQVPSTLDGFRGAFLGSATFPLTVSTPTGTSAPITVAINGLAPGIFAQNSAGCGQGVVQNVASDGSVSLNSPTNSVAPGGIVTLFGTGLGFVYNWPADGAASPTSPLAFSPSSVGLLLNGTPIEALFAGRAPGLVGADQVNVQIPSNALEQCAAALQLGPVYRGAGYVSQPVLVSIKQGGGACADPPPGSYALLEWVKTVYSGNGTVPPSDGLKVEFTQGIGYQLPPDLTLAYPPFGCRYGVAPPVPTIGSCPIPGLSSRNAGALTLQTAAYGPQSFTPITVGGMAQYSISLPTGAITPGTLNVQGSGGPNVGPFQTSVTLPPFQVTSAFPPGTTIKDSAPFTVTWTAGDSSEAVWIRITGDQGRYAECAVSASAGQFTVNPCCGEFGSLAPPTSNAEIMVYTSSGSHSQLFSASGLTQGGRHSWRWVYRFANLNLQ